jgi:hypothetical protein
MHKGRKVGISIDNVLKNALKAILAKNNINVSVNSSDGGGRYFLSSSDSVDALAPFFVSISDPILRVLGDDFYRLMDSVEFEAGSGGLHCIYFSNNVEKVTDTELADRYTLVSTYSTIIDALSHSYGISFSNEGKEAIDIPLESLYEAKLTIKDEVLNLIASGELDYLTAHNPNSPTSSNNEDVYNSFISAALSR